MTTTPIVTTKKSTDAPKQNWLKSRAWRQFRRNRIAVFGLVVVALIAGAAVMAPLIAPADPREQSISNRLKPPSGQNLLGTDRYGRDVFSRLLYGARVSLIVGVSTVVIGGTLGALIGIYSGYKGGRLDRAIGSAVDVILSFPDLLLGIMVLILLGPGLAGVIAAISVSMLPRFIRIARGSTLALRDAPYIEACRGLGVRDLTILLRHLLPNVVGELVVVATLWVASAIRVEASLSFLGLGVQPPTATWGNMIREGLGEIFMAPWIALAPSLAIMLTVLAFNMFGDGLRDAMDPKSFR